MSWESLIFDIDGTLWDSRALVAEGYNLQLNDEGYGRFAVNAEQLRSLFGKTMTEIADILFATLPESDRYPLMERCMERENEYLKDNPCNIGYPEVKETLETLSKDHRLFIVSNSQQGYPELCIEKMGLQDLILGHLCFGDTGTSKGQTIRMLMKQYDIRDCAYVGDTQGDYAASLEAGIPFVWAGYGFGIPDAYDRKIDTFGELVNL